MQLKRFLYNIWPSVYKVINGTLYWLINFVKNLIKMMIGQIKNG